MTIRLPWPEGLTPEEIRQREKERDEKIQRIKEQQRQELETAIANKDVRAMSALAHAAIGRMCRAGSYGMSWLDIDDLRRLAQELAIEGEALLGQRRDLLALHTALAVKGADLRGSTPGPKLEQILTAASFGISELLSTFEAKARRAELAVGSIAAPAPPLAHDAFPPRAEAPVGPSPSLTETQLTIPKIILGLRKLVSPIRGPEDQEAADLEGGSLPLGSVATSQDPLARAIRWGKQHLEQLADRVQGVGVPSLELTLFTKVIKATSATAMLHYVCDAVCRMSVNVATNPALEGKGRDAAAVLGTALHPRNLERIEKQVGIEITLLAEREGTVPKAAEAEKPPVQPARTSDRRDDTKPEAGVSPAAPSPAPQLEKVEQAIALLLRDGREPRSMRKYAEEVGVSHSTLSRDERWQMAWAAVTNLAGKDTAELPSGEKDRDGNLEAEAPAELCENCRQEPVWKAVAVNGGSVRLCEQCARRHK